MSWQKGVKMEKITRQEFIMSVAMQLKHLDQGKSLISCVKEARDAVVEASKK